MRIWLKKVIKGQTYYLYDSKMFGMLPNFSANAYSSVHFVIKFVKVVYSKTRLA